MKINPIQGFKNLSTGKKIATVAGTAAAIGVAALAISKPDSFVKATGIIKDKIGSLKDISVFQKAKEGAENLIQFARYQATKFKAGLIKGAPTAQEAKLQARLDAQEAFATGLTRKFVD